VLIGAALTVLCAPQAPAQARSPDYPEHPPALPSRFARGQQIFRSNCSFCHGSDARGGEAGPNLVRDVVVLRDQKGELITPIVQNGIPAQGMPKFALSTADITDIAAWLHTQPLSDRGTPSTLDIWWATPRRGRPTSTAPDIARSVTRRPEISPGSAAGPNPRRFKI